MVFLNLVVFSSCHLTATFTHCTLPLSTLVVLLPVPHAVLLFRKKMATPAPRKKQIAENRSNLVSSFDCNCCTSFWCLNRAESFSSRTDLRSSSRRRSFSVSSRLLFCTLVYSLRASSYSCSSWTCCCYWLSVNALFDSSSDYHFCTYSVSRSAN